MLQHRRQLEMATSRGSAVSRWTAHILPAAAAVSMVLLLLAKVRVSALVDTGAYWQEGNWGFSLKLTTLRTPGHPSKRPGFTYWYCASLCHHLQPRYRSKEGNPLSHRASGISASCTEISNSLMLIPKPSASIISRASTSTTALYDQQLRAAGEYRDTTGNQAQSIAGQPHKRSILTAPAIAHCVAYHLCYAYHDWLNCSRHSEAFAGFELLRS
jgi:hypothetical protein